MKSNLMRFENAVFGEIRVIEVEGKPYFVGIDIAKALGYAKPNNAINSHCKHTTLKQGIIKDSLGRLRDAVVIPEGDIYRLIIKSKLPQAEKFERWVFDEVLPQIRKTGGYISVTEQDDEAAIMSKALMIAQKTLMKKDELIAQKDERINVLECELEETVTENDALRGEFFSKDDITKIFMLIRRYGSAVGFGRAWNEFYRELYYNFGIRLRSRQGTFEEKFKNADEVAKGIQCAVALCGDNGIRTADILSR